MGKQNRKRIRIVNVMMIVLILILSGINNVCIGQIVFDKYDLEYTQDYFISSKMFDSACIESSDDNLIPISKNQPEYKILTNSLYLKYIGTYKYKNTKYLAFRKNTALFYFPFGEDDLTYLRTQKKSTNIKQTTSIIDSLSKTFVDCIKSVEPSLSDFQTSHEYFFLSSIEPSLLDLVQIEVDDKLKKIKKNQPEYEILRNPQSLFQYRGTFTDKNKTEFSFFYNGDTKYCFPNNDKKGVSLDFCQYAGDYSVHKQILECIINHYGYIDTEKAATYFGMKFTTTHMLYNRFLKLSLKKIELTENQTVKCVFMVGVNECSINYKQFVETFNAYLVPNSKIREFDDLRERVNKYKSWYKYIDIQHATSVRIKNSSNLVCNRFYPIEIKDVMSTDDWKPLVVFDIDDGVLGTDEKGFLNDAAALDVVRSCNDFYDYVEKSKQKYKYLNVFCTNDYISLSNNTLLYGKFTPIKNLKGEINANYDKFIKVECDLRKYDMTFQLDYFESNVYTEEEMEEEKGEYEEVVERFENTKRDYLYYIVDDGNILPMKILDARIKENYEIVEYVISINSSEQNVTSDNFNLHARTKEGYAEELKRIQQEQEEQKRRNAFFTNNLKGYAFYRISDLATFSSDQVNDAEGSFLVGMIVGGISSKAINMVELYKFNDNQNGAFGIKAQADKSQINYYDSDALTTFFRSVSIASGYEEVTTFTYKVLGNQLIMRGETTNVSTGKKSEFSKTLIFNEKDHTLRDGSTIYKRERIE